MRINNYLYRISAMFIILLLFSSCPNDVMRDLVEVKVSDPVADSFIINSGAPTSSLSVTLYSNVTKEDDALEMRFRNESGTWSDWIPYSSSASWDLSIGDGIKTVYAEYRDEGHHVVSMKNSIVFNTGAPAGDFYVWGSAISGNQHLYVNSASVTLCMTISNVESMRFSNTSDSGPWSSWIPYSSIYGWTISGGDGLRTIFAEFRTNAGTTTSSSCNITLDTTAPAVSSFQINSDDATANNTGATLTYSYAEAYTLWAEYRNDSGLWSSSESLSSSPVTKSWALRAETGDRTVYVRLSDIAGNVSSEYSDSISLTITAPSAPVPTAATPTNDTTPTWTWPAIEEADFYQYHIYKNDDYLTTGYIYQPETSFTYDNELQTDNYYTFTIAAAVNDYTSGGGYSTYWSSFSSHTIYIDTTPPSAPNTPVCPQADDGYINSSEYSSDIDINVDFSSSGAVTGDTLNLYIDGIWTAETILDTSDITAESYNFTVSPAMLGAGETKTVTANIEDQAGNPSSFSSSLILNIDITGPTISFNSTPATPSTDTTPTWNWTASDGIGSGIAESRYIYDSGSETSTTLSSFTAPSQSDGTHSFRVRAVDIAGNTSSLTSTSYIVINALPPTAGGGLTYASLWGFGASFGWNAATDAVTPQSSLEYKLVRSSSSNISTVTDAQNNGNTVMNWSSNTTSYTVNNLSPSTTYYFNVIVRDSLGNMSVYTTVSVITPIRPILLFDTSTLYNGNLGGRTGADAKVQTRYDASYSSFNYSNVRCFISISSTDEIRDMISNYSIPTSTPVYSPNGTKIADNFNFLYNNGISSNLLSTLTGAGLSSGWWWSSSNGDGSLSSQNCNGHTDTSPGVCGSSSDTTINATTNNWIWSSSVAGTLTNKLIGICW